LAPFWLDIEEIKTDGEKSDDSMPPLEDTSTCEYSVEGQAREEDEQSLDEDIKVICPEEIPDELPTTKGLDSRTNLFEERGDDTSLGSIKLGIEPVQGPPKVHEGPSPLISPILQPFINQPNTPTCLFIEEPPKSPTSLQFCPFNKTLTFHDFNPPKPCSMLLQKSAQAMQLVDSLICPKFHHAYSIPFSSSYTLIEWPRPIIQALP